MRYLVQWRSQGAQHTEDRSNFAVDCACGHRWHGLKCDRLACQCPTSWVEPT